VAGGKVCLLPNGRFQGLEAWEARSTKRWGVSSFDLFAALQTRGDEIPGGAIVFTHSCTRIGEMACEKERKQKIFPMRRDERRHGFGVLYHEAEIIH